MTVEIISPASRAGWLAQGLYRDIPAARYHADDLCAVPTLSSSIASVLLSASPRHAHLAHPRLNPHAKHVSTKVMDLGSVAHELVLGKGSGFCVATYNDYRTKTAQEWRDGVIARGAIPIKESELSNAQEMACFVERAVSEIPGAELAFNRGSAEVVAIWQAPDNGALCRAMIDWLDLENLVIYDLKTTSRRLEDRDLQSKIASGLDLQAAFYLRGLEHVMPDIAGRISWRWVFVECEAPFELRVIELDAMTRAFGDRKVTRAIEIWERCMNTNEWPGYPREISRLAYPAWAEAAWLEKEIA